MDILPRCPKERKEGREGVRKDGRKEENVDSNNSEIL